MSEVWKEHDGLWLRDQDGTPVADRGVCVTDGIARTTDDAGAEGQYFSHDSVENNGLLVQHNLAASAAPLVTDDNTAGYEVGSFWYDTTNDNVYTAVDVSTGAAVWVQVNNPTGMNEVAVAIHEGISRVIASAYRTVASQIINFDRLPTDSPIFVYNLISVGTTSTSVRLRDVTNAANIFETTGIASTGITTASGLTLPTGTVEVNLDVLTTGGGITRIEGGTLHVGA